MEQLTWPSHIGAQEAADKAREKAEARKARKKQAKADLRPSPQRFQQFQAAAREVGLILTMSKIGKTGQHWMFNSLAGQRVLDYWPTTKRGQQTGGNGFIIGGPTEALAFAVNVTKCHDILNRQTAD